MKVRVSQVSVATRTALVTIGNAQFITRIVIPNNKGKENELWVDIRPNEIKNLLGEGEHKNWITIPRDLFEGEYETLKKEREDNFITITNLIKYVTPEEYATVFAIWEKANKALAIQKAQKVIDKNS